MQMAQRPPVAQSSPIGQTAKIFLALCFVLFQWPKALTIVLALTHCSLLTIKGRGDGLLLVSTTLQLTL